MLSRSRLLPLAVVALAVVLAAAGWLWPRTSDASTAADAAAVRNAIAAVLDAPTAPNAVWGVYVQNLRTGEVVASRNADRSLLPASTLKLVTTARRSTCSARTTASPRGSTSTGRPKTPPSAGTS
jgi:D-alanyl-D-alanine carboxypeptidase